MSSTLTEGTHHRSTHTRSCRNWKTDRLEGPGVEGSTPSERTYDLHRTALGGPEPHPDGREDVCKTSGQRFDSASGLHPAVITTARYPAVMRCAVRQDAAVDAGSRCAW